MRGRLPSESAINAESGLGEWGFGQGLLDRLIGLAADQTVMARQLRPALMGGADRPQPVIGSA